VDVNCEQMDEWKCWKKCQSNEYIWLTL